MPIEWGMVLAKVAIEETFEAVAKEVFDIEDDTTRRLRAIEAKVDDLLESPYRSALLLLQDAADTSSSTERAGYLNQAEAKLRDAAAAFEHDPLSRSRAYVYLSAVKMLLGKSAGARRYGQEALGDADGAVVSARAAFDRKHDVKVGRFNLREKAEWLAEKADDLPAGVLVAGFLFPPTTIPTIAAVIGAGGIAVGADAAVKRAEAPYAARLELAEDWRRQVVAYRDQLELCPL